MRLYIIICTGLSKKMSSAGMAEHKITVSQFELKAARLTLTESIHLINGYSASCAGNKFVSEVEEYLTTQ